MLPVPVHVVVPRLSIVRFLRSLLAVPLMFSSAVAGMVILPPPSNVPPVQSSVPLAAIVRSPEPFRVPLTTSKFSAVTAFVLVAVAPMVTVPPLIRVAPAPVIVVPMLSVKVLEGNCIVAPVAMSKLPVLVPPEL